MAPDGLPIRMSASSVNGSNPVTRTFRTPGENRVLVIPREAYSSDADQFRAFRRTDCEARLPLAKCQCHRDACPVQTAVVGGRAGRRRRRPGVVRDASPYARAPRLGRGSTSSGGLAARHRAEQPAEQLHLLVEPGPAQDLGRYRRSTGDAPAEALLLDRAGDRGVQAAGDERVRRADAAGALDRTLVRARAPTSRDLGNELGRSLIRRIYQIPARKPRDPYKDLYCRQYAMRYLRNAASPRRPF